MSPDITQACWELGSAVFSLLNIRAIRQSKSLAGVHWLPTAFFFLWGVYNLWFYTALHLPAAWWAGMVITITNLIWLAHVAWYVRQRSIRRAVFSELLSVTEAYFAELRRVK